jgi:hypothetical protein
MTARAERAVRGVALVTSAVIVVLTSCRVAAADQQSDQVISTGAMANVAVDMERSATQLTQVTTDLGKANVEVAATQASMNVTLGLITQNVAALNEVMNRIKVRAVSAYTRFGSVSTAPLEVDESSDLNVARSYVKAVADVDVEDLASLRDTEQRLDVELDTKRKDHDAAVASESAIEKTQSDLVSQVHDDQARLDAVGAVPVMGASTLSAAQMASWYRSTGAVATLPYGTTIDDMTELFVEEGNDEHVRGDLAFAQAVVETGSFAVAAGANYSGIGVCDACDHGDSFATPRDGVRAQIQLLKNYADPDSRADDLAHPPSPDLYGHDPAHAAHVYDTFSLKGKAPIWNLMGNGNWATDPGYAPKVIRVYNQMVAFANAHPELS